MDSNSREQLQEQLGEYILETLKNIQTIKEFCDQEEEWTLHRAMELNSMKETSSETNMWSGLIQFTADSKKQALEKLLEKVLKNTLEGLKKLQSFLDSIEMLAVTSLFVFMTESFMPTGVTAASVRSVISNARRISRLLIHFKRDAEAFFQPSFSNVEVLAFQLDKYIRITQQLCEKIEKTSRSVYGSGNCYRWKNGKPEFTSSPSEESVREMSDHLTQLKKIRMDESLRLTFLFDKEALRFIGLFSECSSRMFKFLSDLEEEAVKLDSMKLGSNISSVAGSSVGVVGGVLSIVGLALAPVTAGVSLALTLTGVGLGVTSGVNSIVTGITETAVNSHHGKEANDIFIKFMKDLQKLSEFSEQVASTEGPVVGGAGVVIVKIGNAIVKINQVRKKIETLVITASAIKNLKSEEVAVMATKLGLQKARATRGIPNLAADLPDIGQIAKGTPLALSKSARAGMTALNVFFVGLDVLFIVKDSISLAKGSKNEVAQLIRARSVLWRSEVEALEKISNHLCKGIYEFHRSLALLEKNFYC